MRAVTFGGISRVSVEQVAAPRVVEPSDVVVAVRVAAICGSDLHPYSGRETGLDLGTVMGHEFLGEVVEVGSAVERFSRGDRVVAPFTTSCGGCWYCERGLTARCERGQLFGWVQDGHGLHGGQAEYVRVPLADATLVQAPPGASDEAALLAGDVLSTGFYCAQLGGIEADHVVAVIGAGPVGVCATIAARRQAERVFVFDLISARRELAARHGATALDPADATAMEQIRAATGGRGVDVVLECVGSERATALSYSLVRPGGTIAAAGVHCEPHFAFSPGDAYDKNLTYRAGRCPARAMMEGTMPLVASGEHQLGALFSHRLPFEEAARGYEMFARREDGCTKVLLVP
ncbi:MAG: alcohol dehydrogenase [Planctomycetes bacterium]|nr:alcohol dehydrogenase [Planctomycetota bacterium]